MKPKVFISSTYSDLVPFRERIWEVLSQLDIQILGMERFGARKTAPLQTCIDEVAKSDVYIGVIAFRFGSIDRSSKKSYTQIEYEKAIELKKEILIYLFDSNGLIQPKYIDFGSKAQRLIQFKKVLKEHHTIDTFNEPHELAVKISKRLKEILPKLEVKFVRPKILDARISRFKVSGVPWIAFVGYLNNKPVEIFTGIDDEEMFLIPKSQKTGKIIRNLDEDRRERYDFQYIDRWGYINTNGGLSHEFNRQAAQYTKIITALLRHDPDIDELKDVIEKMVVHDFDNPDDWKEGVLNALNLK